MYYDHYLTKTVLCVQIRYYREMWSVVVSFHKMKRFNKRLKDYPFKSFAKSITVNIIIDPYLSSSEKYNFKRSPKFVKTNA